MTALPGPVEAAIGTLLERSTDDPTAFLGAQFDLGLAWVHFDKGHGGLGAPRDVQREVDRVLREAGAPETPANFVGRHQVASTMHGIGTDEHKQRFLRRIFTGEDRWCQLFSEPGAGSDLANIGALAVRSSDGDRWTVSGQKVWTSGARTAHLALLLARTDPDQPKHRGLTMFVLDMRSPGVEVRPLRQADGGARFSEVFLTDVQLDDSWRVGEVGNGWKVALAVLGTERDGASDMFHRPLDELLDTWRDRRGELPAGMRDDVVRLWIESRVIELGKQRRRAAPEHPDAARLAALSKISTSEHAQRLAELTARVIGPSALVGTDYAGALQHDLESEAAPPANHFAVMPLRRFLIRSRAMSIEGGTNEISRNQIGERTLGLPPDIRIDKTGPWGSDRRSDRRADSGRPDQ